MAHWLSVEDGRKSEGLRLVITAGVPGPWGEAAKAVFQVKGIDCPRVAQFGGQPNEDLVEWTGESNAPQAVYNDEPARAHWSQIIMLGERLAPNPSLLPENPEERALMFGLIHELAGEGGFGWTRRFLLFAPLMTLPPDHSARQGVAAMAERYGYSEAGAAVTGARAAEILALLSRQWRSQRDAGREFLVGDRLSALDLYWAAFAALVEPLPHEVCPMPEMMRAAYGQKDPLMDAALDPELLGHRQRIYEEWLEMPIDLGPGFAP